MAYYLFTGGYGVTDVVLDAPITGLTGDFEIRFKMQLVDNEGLVLGGGSSALTFFKGGTKLEIRRSGNTLFSLPADPRVAIRDYSFVGSAASDNVTLYQDGVSFGTLSGAFWYEITNLIGPFQNSTRDFNLYSAEIYKNSLLTNRYFKDTLVGSNDRTFNDVESGNGAALAAAYPANNSQWIFYDDGANSGNEQAVTSIVAEQFTQANALPVSASFAINSVVAEQLTQANMIDVFLAQLANSNVAEEKHNANALTIEQSASQSVNALIGEQKEEANTQAVEQVQHVVSVTAEESHSANVLTIEQSAGQSVNSITAQQVEQATMLSASQQQALSAVIAEQLSDAGLLDVTSIQASTLRIAQELHEAAALNVQQYTGQLVTLVVAKQENQAQTLFISEVNAVDILQAEQVANAEAVTFSQVQRLTQISAEQLTEAQIISIISSGDNTDLSGIRLMPVTPQYAITPTNTTRYSLKKV